MDKMSVLDISKVSKKWDAKCVLCDMSKVALDYIKERPSDWIILDMSNSRFNLVRFSEGGMCTYSKRRLIKLMEKKGVIPSIEEIIQFDDMSIVDIDRRIKCFADAIKEIYPPERIIILELKMVSLCYNKISKNFYSFANLVEIFRQNNIIKYCFNVLKSELEGCYVVKFPDNVVCDEMHKWGNCTMHYTKEYYEYCLSAIKKITNGAPGENIDDILESMREECSNIYLQKYGVTEEMLRKFEENIIRSERRFNTLSMIYKYMARFTFGKVKCYFKQKRKDLWKMP